MDLFATFSSIVFDTSDSEPATATPIDTDSGNLKSIGLLCILTVGDRLHDGSEERTLIFVKE